MATPLNLEEQEQLDQFKHFWSRYGSLITWVLIAVLAGFAAWAGWSFWQRSQGAQAAVLYEEIERAALANDTERMQRALTQIKDSYGRSIFAAQAALLAGRVQFEAGRPEDARSALNWVLTESNNPSYQAVARLRLAGLDIEAQAFEQALLTLQAEVPPAFVPLLADRRGDVLMAQGKPAEAQAQYLIAWRGMSERTEYRRLVEVKLAALGVDVATLPAVQEAAS